MKPKIVHAKTGVLLVGGGFPAVTDLVKYVAKAPFVIAADGGADFCLKSGLTPEAVIGDLDSVSDGLQADLPEEALIEYEDQDLTDFEKCLRLIEAPFIVATGFTSGRLDHTLANFAILARRIGAPTLLIGTHDVAFAVPEKIALDLPVGTRISLFPMVPTKGTSKGLRWPIDGLTIDPLGRLGTSNEVSGPVEMIFDTAGTIVIIPREHLDQAIAALTG
jgi:thiamine pyrophosphokinase